jgi:GNAT superfamily N-acetyltransferase
MSSGPFRANGYALPLAAGTLTLRPFPANQAERLGTAFAAIDPWASYRYPAAAITSYLAAEEPCDVRFLLQVDGAVAGAVGVQPLWLRGPYIRFLGIVPDFQRRGLGSAILSWIDAEARKQNVRNLWVVASQINTGGIRFYERHGFEQAAVFDALAYDGRDEILLRKRLYNG